MDGRPLTVAEVERIADLESREVLLAKLAGAHEGQPVQGRQPVQRTGVAGRPAGRRSAREEGKRRSCVEATEISPSRDSPEERIRKDHHHGQAVRDDLLDAFKELTLLELSEFVKKFEETFEVTAAAPVASPPLLAPPPARPPRPPRNSRSSTSSSRVPARRRSASSRSSARSSPAWASRRPRTSSTALPSRCSRRSPRRPPRRPRPSSRPQARRSPSSRLRARRRSRQTNDVGRIWRTDPPHGRGLPPVTM